MDELKGIMLREKSQTQKSIFFFKEEKLILLSH